MVTVSPTLNELRSWLTNNTLSVFPLHHQKKNETMYTNHTHEVHFLKNRYFQIEKIDWILLFLIQLQSNLIQLCLMNLRVKEKATVHRVLPPEPPPRRIPRARRRRRSRLPRQSLPRLGILKILSKGNNKDHKDFVFERIRRWFLYWNIYRLWNNHFTRLSLLRSKCANPSILTILPVLVINVNHVKDVKRSPQKSDGGYEWCISEKTIFLDR